MRARLFFSWRSPRLRAKEVDAESFCIAHKSHSQQATVVCFWDLCHCQLLLQVLLLATETALRGYGIYSHTQAWVGLVTCARGTCWAGNMHLLLQVTWWPTPCPVFPSGHAPCRCTGQPHPATVPSAPGTRRAKGVAARNITAPAFGVIRPCPGLPTPRSTLQGEWARSLQYLYGARVHDAGRCSQRCC